MTVPRLVGMIHLAPLPGSSRFAGDLQKVLKRAVQDADSLEGAGFDALMIENFGDAPFHTSRVPTVTVAAMTAAVDAIAGEISIPFGVNVLRNDGRAAVAIAAATGASFVRINILTGIMITDQGTIEGEAAQIALDKRALAPDLDVFADVFVKHAVPPPGLTIEQAARDTWERGGAGALVVSGSGTGVPVDRAVIAAVRAATPAAPLLIGSGATASTVAGLLETADGVIVGSALKDHIDDPIDPVRARAFVEAAS